MRATELAVDATIDKAGMPNGKDGLRSVRKTTVDTVMCTELTVIIYLVVQMCNLIVFLPCSMRQLSFIWLSHSPN